VEGSNFNGVVMSLDRFIGIKPKEDEGKIEVLKNLLKDIGIEGARIIEERVDQQFKALEYLHKNLQNNELFIKLVIANALVSYQLSSTGENWWWEFSKYFSKKRKISIYQAYKEFLPSSKTNKRLVNVKLSRLEKVNSFLEGLTLDELKAYYQNMLKLNLDLANILNADKSAKTIVFAVKMFGYASRIVFDEFISYPMEIAIPKDVRISNYTKRFTSEDPTGFWNRIAKEVKIPPLHIDSILWTALGRDERVKRDLKIYLGEKAERVLKLVNL